MVSFIVKIVLVTITVPTIGALVIPARKTKDKSVMSVVYYIAMLMFALAVMMFI